MQTKMLLVLAVVFLFTVPSHAQITPHIEKAPKSWYILSAIGGVAVTMDTAQTIKNKDWYGTGFREDDPLARPLVELPNPAYAATNVAIVSGLDLLGLRMRRSPRWHKIWWVPQVAQIAVNFSGYGYSRDAQHPTKIVCHPVAGNKICL